ncbi:spore coat U domain-containing protein [Bacillus subtilis]|uniref:Csu type fimbrial protein n=1 Tax=Pseudochrobactrum asaccharolyticum TaxID=354351 RepID=UPI001F403140|nr:spore coat U domain-containing protein [Pseudochrobactrum asaccharolyticum]MCF7647235.1 spore coat U domain-containing protein [Pseudochrobactrum asaccharolyticum]MCF7673449.1 spore coat U domain-containing protein [Bacillus subtilis]
MMTIKQIMLGLSALALSASLAPAAYAATDTGTLTVKTRIGAACTLKTKNATLDFGNLTTISDKNHDANTSITVQCSKGQAYHIYMRPGLNPLDWNTSFERRMQSGSGLLSYFIFLDSAHTKYWLDKYWENGLANRSVQATGDGTDQKYPVYGVIYKAATTPQAGDYTDTVAITVEY